MATDSHASRPGRRYDPERRERIARAAIEVVARDGIEGLTHRTVAQQADVPLGSTTYHFADKDDLLKAAAELAEDQNRETLDALLVGLLPEEDLPAALGAMVEELTVRQRAQLLLDYELFLAARSRPALRETATRWVRRAADQLSAYTDATTAASLTWALEGALVQAVVLGREIRADDATAVFRRILSG